MKKTYSFILALALIFTASVVFGQGYTFRVLANKGNNQVKKAGTSTAVPLKTGATINAEDELIVSADAYIGLMHKSGKTVEVREAGTKKVSDLEAKISTSNSSTASRYAQFIANKMNEDNSSYASRMNATGAVSRATGSNAIEVMLPSSVDFLGDNAIISWVGPEETAANTKYVVTVMNIFDEVIYEEEVSGSKVTLDFTKESMQNETGLYIFSVKQADDEEIKSGNVGIKRVSADDMAEVVSNYNNLKSEVSDDSPLNKLIYASFFEENGLLLDAMTKYEEAIKLSPEVEDFKELYNGFLLKNGLSK
jgi:hypothetical protein